MKKSLIVSLIASAAILGLCGCASDNGSKTAGVAQSKPAKPHKDKRSKAERLKVGMTMDEVIAAIGKPKGRAMSSDGSAVWTYNDSEKAAFIPYYALSGGKTHFLTVVFDTNGKVKSWSSSSQSMY